jgi:hypothetical protein
MDPEYIRKHKKALIELWQELELGPCPHPRQFAVWLLDYESKDIASALAVATAPMHGI